MCSLSDGDTPLQVIALGNRYRGDDGIAPLLLERLMVSHSSEVVGHDWGDSDALTLAHDLLQLEGDALILDCAELGQQAGSWRLFDEAALCGYRGHSTHGLGLADALALVRPLGFVSTVHCFGIQPADLSDREGLSEVLTEQLPAIESALFTTLNALREARGT